MQGKVDICGVNTSRLTVLTSVETEALLRRAKEGDEAARQKLIEGNLRLVLSVIQRFDKRGECPDDLFQVGCIGLIKAIDCFDLKQNVQFSTYGVPMIAGEVRRYLRDNNVVRVSRSLRDLAYKAIGARESLAKSLKREPTEEEVIRIGTMALRAQCLTFPLVSFITLTNMYLQTTNQTRSAVMLAIARHGLFLIPALVAGALLGGLKGIIAAQPISDTLAFILAIPLCISALRKMK